MRFPPTFFRMQLFVERIRVSGKTLKYASSFEIYTIVDAKTISMQIRILSSKMPSFHTKFTWKQVCFSVAGN